MQTRSRLSASVLTDPVVSNKKTWVQRRRRGQIVSSCYESLNIRVCCNEPLLLLLLLRQRLRIIARPAHGPFCRVDVDVCNHHRQQNSRQAVAAAERLRLNRIGIDD